MVETSSCLKLLTPHTYHTWKTLITRLLRSKGLWSCLDVMQPTFFSVYQNLHHRNKMDEKMGLFALQVYDSLQFHLDGCNDSLDMWTKLDGLFGTMNEFRELQIEVELTSLVPDAFSSIEDFLMKFKQQRSLLQGYRCQD